ncbi:hypothetical protein YC2023_032909 [Brassica napus]
MDPDRRSGVKRRLIQHTPWRPKVLQMALKTLKGFPAMRKSAPPRDVIFHLVEIKRYIEQVCFCTNLSSQLLFLNLNGVFHSLFEINVEL